MSAVLSLLNIVIINSYLRWCVNSSAKAAKVGANGESSQREIAAKPACEDAAQPAPAQGDAGVHATPGATPFLRGVLCPLRGTWPDTRDLCHPVHDPRQSWRR